MVAHLDAACCVRLVVAIGLVGGPAGCATMGASMPDGAGGAAGTGMTAVGGGSGTPGAFAMGSGGTSDAYPGGAAGAAGLVSTAGGTGWSNGGAAGAAGHDASAASGTPGTGGSSASGGAGGSGGSGGAGGSSGSGTAGAPGSVGCARSTFALCEDFESGTLDTALWKLTESKGTATLDSSRAARGSKYSVHVQVDPGSDTMVGLVESRTFPALKAGLFARAFIFIPGAMTTSLFTGDRHSRLIYAQGASPYGEYALGIWNGGLIQNHYSQSDDSVDTKMLPPFDQWFCLEYELDSAAGNVKAYLNDVEITALRHDGWPASSIDTLMFGVDRYGAFPVTEDIWFDELVVDGARIGCTR